ncbi:pentatricopeptide repeat-containing protein At4g35130, chloroplastic [Curcuma longa]|uniref:pentatricopeptide repeat-containing protein At4g35130, chloroplastic n=1 Tax=Curcuma longa TaxID=136217 RepID=UPI003D9EC81B
MATALLLHCSASVDARGISSHIYQRKQQQSTPSLEPHARLLTGVSASSAGKPRTSRPNQARIARTLLSFITFGRIQEALSLFESIQKPDTFLWNLMIRGCATAELYEDAIGLYRRMQGAGVRADHFTFPFVIKSCANVSAFEDGLKVHAKLFRVGLDSDLFICNSLVAMYLKIGFVEDAENVFDEMPVRDDVSWNSLVNGYVSNGEGWKALRCVKQMQERFGSRLDWFGITSALAACSSVGSLKHGKEIHCYVMRNVLEVDIKLQTTLLDMYCKTGDMACAESLFNSMSVRNVVTWNALVGGYALNGEPQLAFASATQMQDDGVDLDVITLVNLLPACAESKSLHHGKSVHAFATRRGLIPHLVLETALVDMYAKCGKVMSSLYMFEKMSEKSLVSWNAMISGYVQNGRNIEAIQLFLELQKSPLLPDAFTISTIALAYAKLAWLWQGKQIHSYPLKLGYQSDSVVMNSIICMYAMCGDMNTSRLVFDRLMHKNVASWNMLIMGYGIHGQGETALKLFSDMKECGLKPDQSTFTSVLTACSTSGLIDEGWLHFSSMRLEYDMNPEIEHYGCMVDLLGRSGDLEAATNFINKMPMVPTARIWGSLLTASKNNRNIEVAEYAAEKIFQLEHENTGCYILLSSMYADAGKREDAERMMSLMKQEGLEKTTVRSLVELGGQSCSFINGDRLHAQSSRIHEVSSILLNKIGEATYDPGNVFNPTDMVIKKNNSPNRHSVKLAVVFGLISSPVGIPVLVKKNGRICNRSHQAIKLISGFNGREIIVGDTKIYHHFINGRCTCGDYW